MKKRLLGMITGALLFTFVSGTAVQAWEATFEDAVDTVLSDAGVAGADAAVYKKVWGENAFVYDWNGKYRSAPDPNQYQGTNVVLYTPGDVPIEIQFHTETSFRTKQDTHRFYEVIRSRDCSPEEKAEAIRQQAILNSRIPVPEGARDLRFPV